MQTNELSPVPVDQRDHDATVGRKFLINPSRSQSIHVELTSGELLTIAPMQMVRVPADEQVVRASYLA